MQSKVLLVLYVDDRANQQFCVYAGGLAEADQEKEIMLLHGLVECGRIWVKELKTGKEWGNLEKNIRISGDAPGISGGVRENILTH